MIAAFDVHYLEDGRASAAAVLFSDYSDSEPEAVYTKFLTAGAADYIPGELYRRELPCILTLLKQINKTLDEMIVDGYVMLGNKPGLGQHLFESFDGKIPVIGVAKSKFEGSSGAYSLIVMTEDTIIAARDPNGFRPLCLGRLDSGYVLASETCAFDLVEAEYIRDIAPGEILIINQNGLKSIPSGIESRISQCIFELIYFARPDSNVFGQNVYVFRKKQGELLAREFPLEVDLMMPFPDSGNYAAIGYAQASGVPLEMGMIRNHYVGRTFIQPSQSMRDFGVKVKLNPVKDLLKDQRVLIIEDSIIRGTTAKTRIKTLRKIGAREIHMLVSCPPHSFPCHYGIDFSTRGELIASRKSVAEIRDFIGLDSLGYLNINNLIKATEIPRENLCLACFDGKYPVPIDDKFSKYCLENA